MRPQVGQVINNKYRLIRIIGDGGMGSVYEARHEVLGTTVALKFLHPELSRRSGLVQRFLQEARVSAQIQSPHVVRVTDVDQSSNGLAFIVMEYLEGRTLQTVYEDLYRAGLRLSYADALEYAMQMLEGVEAAHRAGVVHRDLKPDNVIITKTPKGEPLLKLLDFGIAKLKVTGQLDRGLTRPGVIMGTPEYMAPEQAYSADTVDARADIFSLGVMIFEMLAGRRPVGGDEPHSIAAAYLSGQISRMSELAPSLAPELCAAVHRAVSPMPADRFASVAEFREAIEPFARVARAPSALTPVPAGTSQPRASDPQAAPSPAAVPPTTSGTSPASLDAPALSPAPADRLGSASAGAEITPAPAAAAEPWGVPKTIPPEDDAPAAAPTPLGGFTADAPGAVASSAPGVSPEPTPAPAMAAAGPIEGGFPATVSAAPYVPPNGAPAGTVQRETGTLGAGAEAMEVAPRPGGTAIGEAPLYMGAQPDAVAQPDARPYAPVQGLAGTAPMDPLPLTEPSHALKAAGRAAKGGPPLLLIVLLAMGISGVAVGGVYIAHELGRPEEQADPAPTPPLPSATVVASEPPPSLPASDPTPTPPATTTAKPPPKPTSTAKPPPTTPPTSPTTPPTSPTTPPTSPTTPPSSSTSPIPGLPPIIMPSTFPFPFPPPPGTSPPPPGTSTGPTKKPFPHIPIPIPTTKK